jgi:hypothetical protein
MNLYDIITATKYGSTNGFNNNNNNNSIDSVVHAPSYHPASSPFYISDIVRNILSFVGPNQYRFIGGINSQFRNDYFLEFPNNNQWTYVNASTLEHAMLCQQEIFHMDRSDLETNINAQYALYRSAGRYGNKPAVEYLLSVVNEGMIWHYCQTLCCYAARYGHVHILKYVISQNFPLDYRNIYDNICDTATKYGHIHILQAFLAEFRLLWDEYTCANAARYGYLNILQWYRHHGCPWDGMTCQRAVEAGHIHILTWATAHGCPWNGGC